MLEVSKITIGKICLKKPSVEFVQKRLCDFVGKPQIGLWGTEFDGVNSRSMEHMFEEMKEISLNGTKTDADKYISRHFKGMSDEGQERNVSNILSFLPKSMTHSESKQVNKLFGFDKLQNSLIKKLNLELGLSHLSAIDG